VTLAVVRSLDWPRQLHSAAELDDFEQELVDQYALAAKGENLIIIEDATSAAATAEATSSAFAQWIHKAFPWW